LDLINGFWTRLKVTWQLWTTGAVTAESTIALSEQQALNYAETLKSAIKDVKDFKKNHNKTHKETQIYNEGDCV